MLLRVLKNIPLCAAFLALTSVVSATNFVVNPDFEGFAGSTNHFNNTPAPGWTTLAITPDTFSADTNFSGYKWSSSQSGGDFLHGIGFLGQGEAVGQNLTGLTIGATYEFSFEQSISASDFEPYGSGYWLIGLGSEFQAAAMMFAPVYGVAADWQWQTLSFTATAETMALTLTAVTGFTRGSTPWRSELAIDGLYFGTPRPNPPEYYVNPPAHGVPDAGNTALLAGSALLLIALLRRRTRA